MNNLIFIVYFAFFTYNVRCEGLDPWDHVPNTKRDAAGLDPWDAREAKIKNSSPSKAESNDHCNCKNIKTILPSDEESTVAESFYKKNLRMIIDRSGFKEQEGVMEGTVHLELTKEEFALIDRYLSSESVFAPSDYRTLDGLLGKSMKKPSRIVQTLEKIVEIISSLIVNHYMNGVVFFGLLILFFIISRIHWKSINYKQFILLIFFLGAIIYEILAALKEAETKEHNNFVDHMGKCEGIWYYWPGNCKPLHIKTSEYWYFLNPIRIVANLFSKVVANFIIPIVNTMNDIIKNMSGGLPWGVQGIVHCCLSVLLFVLILYITCALVFNLVFNIPFNISFLLLNLNFLQKKKEPKMDRESPREQVNAGDTHHLGGGDRISGANLTKFISVIETSLEMKSSRDQLTDKKLQENMRHRSVPSTSFKFKSKTDRPFATQQKSQIDERDGMSERQMEHSSLRLRRVSSLPRMAYNSDEM